MSLNTKKNTSTPATGASSASVLIAGTPITSVTVANQLQSAGHRVVGVLCPFPKPVGRKKVLTPSALELWAVEQKVPVFRVNKELLKDKDGFTNILNEQISRPAFLVSADFGYLIPAWLLEYPEVRSLNVHPSDLPRWRGATPVPFTILHGEAESAISIIEMSPRFDTGGVVQRVPLKILPNESTEEVLLRAFKDGGSAVAGLFDRYSSSEITPTPQPADSPTPYARKFVKEDGMIPFECLEQLFDQEGRSITKDSIQENHSRPTVHLEYEIPTNAISIHNMIRALSPWPGIWTILPSGKRLILLSSTHDETAQTVQLLEAKLEGKGAQSYAQVMRSVSLARPAQHAPHA